MLSGRTTLIAHIGHPTEGFKAPLIYNPWFVSRGIDAAVVPMGVRAEDYAAALPLIFRMTNVLGALVTMPHKRATIGLVDEVTPTARIAGAANAVLKRPDGTLLADMFDGAGFVRGMERKGRRAEGAHALVVGSGGVGSAIAASLAAAGLAAITLFDTDPAASEALASRLRAHYPRLAANTGSRDPAGCDIVVNATPLGSREGDPPPLDPERLGPATFVGEVVMRETYTPLLRAARAKGCSVQVGTDMLFEQIPAYLEFFGFGTTTPDDLRAVAQLDGGD